MTEIGQVYLMSNGMVVVFDMADNQMPELQGHWDSVKKKLFEKLGEQSFKPVIYDQNAFERRIVDLYNSKGETVRRAYFGHD